MLREGYTDQGGDGGGRTAAGGASTFWNGGEGGLARAAIAWCDPGRAVVCVSLASGRSWMVLPASRAHRASGVAEAVRRERRRRMFQGAGVDRTGSETLSEHVVVTETRI